jgi:hypothetical protein
MLLSFTLALSDLRLALGLWFQWSKAVRKAVRNIYRSIECLIYYNGHATVTCFVLRAGAVRKFWFFKVRISSTRP